MLKIINKIFDIILIVTGYFAGLICILIMLIFTYEVIMRYLFDKPTYWGHDIATLSLLFLTPIAAAWVLKREGHVRVEVILVKLKERNRALLNCITSLLAFIACFIFFWVGFEMFLELYKTKINLHRTLIIPKYTVIWPLPFGAFLLCLQFIRRAWESFRIFKKR